MKTPEQRDREWREAQEALMQLKAAFVKERDRLLAPVAEKMEAFLNRHLWIVDNRVARFLDWVYEIQVRIWRWFWK